MSKNNENLGCLLAILNLFGIGKKTDDSGPLPFRVRDDFLSPAETVFYRALTTAANGRAMICPKVNLADLFFVIQPQKNFRHRARIAQKHVDFVLCDQQSLRPLAGIELDDASHARPDRQERDDFVDQVFASASLPLIHVPCRAGYDVGELSRLIGQHLQKRPEAPAVVVSEVKAQPTLPICPKCGVSMVRRESARGAFYGCPNFPKCRQTAELG